MQKLSAEKFHDISPGKECDDNPRTPVCSSLTTLITALKCLPADGISAALWMKERELGTSRRQLYV
jgi:hypothetical protein